MTAAFILCTIMFAVNLLFVIGSTVADEGKARNYRAASVGIALWNLAAMALIAALLLLQWWANALNNR